MDLTFGTRNDDVITAPKTGISATPTLRIGDSDNIIFAWWGNDKIGGGSGNDLIFAGRGNDVVRGEMGNDTVFGGRGDDTIIGGAGDDLLFGGKGDDVLQAGPGKDYLFGGKGDDVLRGGDGQEGLLSGGKGNDRLVAGASENTLYLGGKGNDSLRDGNGLGNDTLVGGSGEDHFTFSGRSSGPTHALGGKGADTFFVKLDDTTAGGAAPNADVIIWDYSDQDALRFEANGATEALDDLGLGLVNGGNIIDVDGFAGLRTLFGALEEVAEDDPNAGAEHRDGWLADRIVLTFDEDTKVTLYVPTDFDLLG